ncbi:MAG TPA: hypothetical protein VKX25_14290 [Bryobacteraceae bacterium]|nr:hypothetical protein [Bryobacteraceae bacterium]
MREAIPRIREEDIATVGDWWREYDRHCTLSRRHRASDPEYWQVEHAAQRESDAEDAEKERRSGSNLRKPGDARASAATSRNRRGAGTRGSGLARAVNWNDLTELLREHPKISQEEFLKLAMQAGTATKN